MEPGRELNLLVARKLFNWECNHPHCDGIKRIRCGACGQWGHGNCYGNGTGQLQVECDHCPYYSESIEDAWEVIEKLINDGCYYAIKGVGKRSRVSIQKYDADGFSLDVDIKVDANSVPLAICLASLKAYGIEVE